MPKKPGRPVTNQIVNTIPATGEEIAEAICFAADGKIKQSLGQGQPPSGRRSVSSKASASVQAAGETCHLSDRIFGADVLASGELGRVAVEVLGAELVERAHVRPLKQRPERFDLVGVGLPSDVLADAVLDDLMGVVLMGVAVG